MPRVQRGKRILVNELNFTPQLAERLAAEMPGIDTVDSDMAAIGLFESQQDPRKRRFAGAGLADQRVGAAALHLEAHGVQCLQMRGA